MPWVISRSGSGGHRSTRANHNRLSAEGNRQPSPGEKILELGNRAAAAGFQDAPVPLREVWDRVLRNTSFHADYSVTRSGVRTVNPGREYSWAEYDNLVNGALAYHRAFSELYKLYVGSYDRPIEIPVHPGFSPDPDEHAIVVVHKGHGVIGVKDAWTREQLTFEGPLDLANYKDEYREGLQRIIE